MNRWHFAQFISISRLVLAPVAMIYLTDIEYKCELIMLIVSVGGLSDFLDGYVARYQGKTSRFGAVLDFTADKIFILSVLFVLSLAGDLPVWISLVIFYREIMVMGLRLYAAYENIEIKASSLGKFKTAILFTAIFALLLKFEWSIYLFYLCVIITVYSFIDYVNRFLKQAKI